jgi:beta-galactosidase
VVIFTNCSRVELSLNKHLIGILKKEEFPEGVIKTIVPYEKGELVAHAYYLNDKGETQSVSDTLITSHAPFALTMHPDRNQVREDKRVIQITTRVVDSTGELNPGSSHMVNYQLDGPGRIRAIDNGDLADHTSPESSSKEVRKGKQLLILQAGSEPGDLIISASAEGLRPSTVKIKNKE